MGTGWLARAVIPPRGGGSGYAGRKWLLGTVTFMGPCVLGCEAEGLVERRLTGSCGLSGFRL